MKIYIFVIGFLIIQSKVSFAQSGQELIYQQIPASPEVSDVFRYNPSQNNMFRGSVGLNIPLLTVNSDHLSLSGSVNYQSTGIQVGSIASTVGSEWQLNMGGSISRIVKDQPDDAKYYQKNVRQCMSQIFCRNCEICPFDDPSPGNDCETCREENHEGTFINIAVDEANIGYLYNSSAVDEIAKKEITNLSLEESVFINGNYYNLFSNISRGAIQNSDIVIDIDAQDGYCAQRMHDLVEDELETFIDVAFTVLEALSIKQILVLGGIVTALGALGLTAETIDGEVDDGEILPYLPLVFVDDIIDRGLISEDCLSFDVLRPIYDTYDTEPDQFAFEFDGYSGRFVFDKNGEVKLFSHQDLKFEYTLDPSHIIEPDGDHDFDYLSNYKGAIIEFKITTPNGVKYYFNEKEISLSNSELQTIFYEYEIFPVHECSPPIKNPYRVDMSEENAAYTTWRLSRVEVPTISDVSGFEEITFEYENTFFINHSNYSQTQQYSCTDPEPSSSDEEEASLSENRNSTVEYQFGKQLTAINWKRGGGFTDGGQILLTHAQDREDLHYPLAVSALMGDHIKVGRLTDITVYPQQGNKAKNIKFIQTYFNQIPLSCDYTPAYVTAHNKRLRLDEIIIEGWDVDGGYDQMPPYKFTYNSTPLPPRHSPKRDYWGYYNGVGTSLVDKSYAYFVNGSQNQSDTDRFRTVYSILNRNNVGPMSEIVVDFNNGVGGREPDVNYAKAGILEMVEFPTGATNEFTYEPHTIGNPSYEDGSLIGGLRLTQIIDSKGLVKTYNYNSIESEDYSYSSGFVGDIPQFASSNRKGVCFTTQSCDGDIQDPLISIIRNTILHSSPVNESIDGFSVGYTKVTEKLGTQSDLEAFGKTVYEYAYDNGLRHGNITIPDFSLNASSGTCYNENFYEQPSIYNSYCRTYQDFHPFPPLPNTDWKKGLLELKTTYDENEQIIQIEDPEYEMFCALKVYGIKSTNNRDVSSFYDEIVDRSMAAYYYLSGDIRTTSTLTEYSYDGGTVLESSEYHYEQNNTLPYQIDIYQGGELARTESFTYANSPTQSSQLMIDNYMIGIPIEQSRDAAAGGAKQNIYQVFANRILLHETKSFGHNDDDPSPDQWRSQLKVTKFNAYGKPENVELLDKAAITNLRWDDRGNLDQINYGQRIWDYGFNDFNQFESITDHNGVTAKYGYDPQGRTNKIITNNNRIRKDLRYTIKDDGSEVSTALSTMPDGLGYETLTTYDAYGRQVSEIKQNYLDGGGTLTSTTTYDELGNIETITNPAHADGTSIYRYDLSPMSRLKEIIPAGSPRPTFYRYGGNGLEHIISYTDEDKITTHRYTDIFGRKTKTIDGLENSTIYKFNARDQISTITPPGDGTAYSFTYYPGGALSSKSIPDKGTHAYTYDKYDMVHTETLPNGKLLVNAYHGIYNDFLLSRTMNGQAIESYESVDPNYVSDFIRKEEYSIHTGVNGNEVIVGQKHTIVNSEIDEDFGRPLTQNIESIDGTYIKTLSYDDLGNILSINNSVTAFGETETASQSWTFPKGIRQKIHSFTYGQVNGRSNNIYNGNDWLQNKELGQIIQNISYDYNPRGWLTKINSVSDVANFGGNGCDENDPPPVPNLTCQQLLELIQGFLISYDCTKLEEGDPTAINLTVSEQTFNNGLRISATQNQIEIPISGGSDQPLPDNIEFSTDGSSDVENLSSGIYQILLDCIANNPVLISTLQSLITQGISSSNISLGVLDEESDEVPESDDGTTAPVFGMEIYYYEANPELEAKARYNGNISWMKWKTIGDHIHAYGFTYDHNDRLEKAKYGEISKPTNCELEKTEKYTVSSISYDPLGNIQALNRRGLLTSDMTGNNTYGMIDALMYKYTSGSPSLLTSVSETEEEEKGFKGTTALYNYDGTGNMIYASNKALSTTYSYHDMPVQMVTPNGKIQNFYTSSGQKLKSVLLPDNSAPNDGPTITNYFDNIEYENSEVKAVYFDEGRAVTSKEGDYIEYFLTDHLGNTRVRISDKDQNNKVHYNINDPAKDEVMSSHHYYPFGMEWDMPSFDFNGNSLASTGKDTEYTYNGKELLSDLDINLHDYGARYYDPAIARWTSVDAYAEVMPEWSTYKYGMNNPMLFTDPDGNCEICGKAWRALKSAAGSATAYVAGAANAIASNAVGGAPGTRGNPNDFGPHSQAAASGQQAGDVISVGLGTAAVILSAVGVAAEGAAAGPTLGATALVIAPTAAVGVAGGVMAATGASNIVKAEDGYAPDRELPRNSDGTPDASADGANGASTQLGTKKGRNGNYRQAREFDSNGNVVKDIDFTDHGRPNSHTNPHEHKYVPNSTGGTPSRSKVSTPLNPKQ